MNAERDLVGVREFRQHLRRQIECARVGRPVDCFCGKKLELHQAFKCLYCSEWFCSPCAEKHFGKTREQYRRENPEPDFRRFLADSNAAKEAL